MENERFYPVGKMCNCFRVSRNSYYWWKKQRGSISETQKRREKLKDRILNIWEESRRNYGSLKVREALLKERKTISRSYVAQLMNELGIASMVRRKYVITTDSDHQYPLADNLLNREFEVNKLGNVWVSDITYIRFGSSWLYLTTMIDLADRQVVGWSLSDDMTCKNTVLKAWKNARVRRNIKPGFLLHSDRGSQYAANEFRLLFENNSKAKQSMSRKGNCWDNAVAESFFKTIKCELIHREDYKTYNQAYVSIQQYIQWYNTERIHQSLGYLTPLEKEAQIRGREYKNTA